MKNVDVPLWDKGDSTDNFAKGGGASNRSQLSLDGMVLEDKNIQSAFKIVLNRKPSTREIAYYRISRMPKNEIMLKLLAGQEHKDLVQNGKKYPEAIQETKDLQQNILKLKSEYQSRVVELEDLNKLLKEKNSLITELRGDKKQPYLVDAKIVEESRTDYSRYGERESAAKRLEREKPLFDKIIDILFK